MVGSRFVGRPIRAARLAFLVGLLAAPPSVALARTETLRWQHPDPAQVTGYRLYIGPTPRLSGPYTSVIDLGWPVPDPDGSHSYAFEVADDETVYVALTAYSPSGQESAYSNEGVRAPEPPPLPPSPEGTVLWHTFESVPHLGDPVNWVDTQANNSMVPDDSLFKVFDLGGNKAFGTDSVETNIHSHYISAGSPDWSAYELWGRMLVTDPAGGIGVTVHSQYTTTDAYYRLGRSGTGGFSMAPHPNGVSLDCQPGVGVVPQANVWYRFRLEVAPGTGATSLRAMVWEDGTGEPATWQVVCEDSRPERLLSGTIGVWSMSAGSKYWDDLKVVDPSGQIPRELPLAPPVAPELSLP